MTKIQIMLKSRRQILNLSNKAVQKVYFLIVNYEEEVLCFEGKNSI